MNDVHSVELDIGKPNGFDGVPDVPIADVYADYHAGFRFLSNHLGCHTDAATDIDNGTVLTNMICKEIRGGLNAHVAVETVADHPFGQKFIIEFADRIFVWRHQFSGNLPGIRTHNSIGVFGKPSLK